MLSQTFVTVALIAIAIAAPMSRRAALDFGSCSDPTIKFADGLDGRKEPAFAPNNSADFNHGSALNIGVISSFICGQLQSACKAGQDAIDACKAGQQAAAKLTGQSAADAFNKAVTGSASSSAGSASTALPPTVSTTDSNCVATVTVTVSPGASTPTSAAAVDPAAASASSTSTAGSSSGNGNLQTFTGSLGGLPPAVTKGGKGFVTGNSDFLNLAAALGRSCDVQHNACANAANSGAGSFRVADCDAQNTACKAAANGA